MRLRMQEKKAVSQVLTRRYRMATKKQKRVMLDEFCSLTGYHRVHARRVLRRMARGKTNVIRRIFQKRRGRKKKYAGSVVVALKQVWGILDGICGKRLVTALPNVVPILEKHGEMIFDKKIRQPLLTMSAATIDRILAPDRKRFALRGRSLTKPGTLLKHQIPIRTFSEWNEHKPGFVEIDLVGHDGGNLHGDFACTLDVTDVHTQWTETQAVKNKAQVWVFQALKEIRSRLPFPVLGIDSDNGSEFINGELFRYCKEEKITFTRSRSYRKNDSCHVEEKNYSIVRRFVGYRRYDTEEELRMLNSLYQSLRLYTNFFLPSMKLIKKIRIGSKVKKQYDLPKTPYQRVLESPQVSKKKKQELSRQYATLNPAYLKREINRWQDKLVEFAKHK